MGRRSLRTTTASAGRSSSKRPQAADESPELPTKKRVKTKAPAGKTTTLPTRSKYFESASEKEDSPESAEDEASGYEDEDEEGIKSSSSEDEDEEASDVSGADVKPTKRGRPGKSVPASAKKGARGKALLKTGAETGLEPGTQIVIKKPKKRDDGGIPYADDTIHPYTMLFLQELAQNNDRDWLKMHDPDFRTALKDFDIFLEALTQRIIEVDETIPELPTKDIIFRIYRDVRFSNDKTPYKTHFSAAWSRTGRKGPYACYYVQVKPGGSFVGLFEQDIFGYWDDVGGQGAYHLEVAGGNAAEHILQYVRNLAGGGLWCPEAAPLALLRTDIDRKPHRLKTILKDARLRKEILGVAADDEKKAVNAFLKQNEENALKTKPKGYDADHKNINLLRLRNFTMGKKLTDKEIIGPNGLDRITDLISCLVPFITYLNSVVMPDQNAEGGSYEGDDDEDEGENVSGSDG